MLGEMEVLVALRPVGNETRECEFHASPSSPHRHQGVHLFFLLLEGLSMQHLDFLSYHSQPAEFQAVSLGLYKDQASQSRTCMAYELVSSDVAHSGLCQNYAVIIAIVIPSQQLHNLLAAEEDAAHLFIQTASLMIVHNGSKQVIAEVLPSSHHARYTLFLFMSDSRMMFTSA